MSKLPVSRELLSASDLSDHFGCSRSTLWRWVKSGAIPKPVKIGGMNRWRRADIEAVTEAA